MDERIPQNQDKRECESGLFHPLEIDRKVARVGKHFWEYVSTLPLTKLEIDFPPELSPHQETHAFWGYIALEKDAQLIFFSQHNPAENPEPFRKIEYLQLMDIEGLPVLLPIEYQGRGDLFVDAFALDYITGYINRSKTHEVLWTDFHVPELLAILLCEYEEPIVLWQEAEEDSKPDVVFRVNNSGEVVWERHTIREIQEMKEVFQKQNDSSPALVRGLYTSYLFLKYLPMQIQNFRRRIKRCRCKK